MTHYSDCTCNETNETEAECLWECLKGRNHLEESSAGGVLVDWQEPVSLPNPPVQSTTSEHVITILVNLPHI